MLLCTRTRPSPRLRDKITGRAAPKPTRSPCRRAPRPRNQNPAIPGTLNYNDANQLSHAHTEGHRTPGFAWNSPTSTGLKATPTLRSECSELRALLEGDEVTANFLQEVQADAPDYRPPDVQPNYARRRSFEPLAGDVAPVLHAGKFCCPHGDYVWYRPAVGTPIPACPTHGPGLART